MQDSRFSGVVKQFLSVMCHKCYHAHEDHSHEKHISARVLAATSRCERQHDHYQDHDQGYHWRSYSAMVVVWVIVIGSIPIGVNHYTATEKQAGKNNESDTHGGSPGGCANYIAHPEMVVKRYPGLVPEHPAW